MIFSPLPSSAEFIIIVANFGSSWCVGQQEFMVWVRILLLEKINWSLFGFIESRNNRKPAVLSLQSSTSLFCRSESPLNCRSHIFVRKSMCAHASRIGLCAKRYKPVFGFVTKGKFAVLLFQRAADRYNVANTVVHAAVSISDNEVYCAS